MNGFTTKRYSILLALVVMIPAFGSWTHAAPEQDNRSRIWNIEAIDEAIANIETVSVANSLEIEYFGRSRGEENLPVEQAVEIIKRAIKTEKVGSRKWSLLQKVLSTAAFMRPEISVEDGFAAYNALFDQSSGASTLISVQAQIQYTASVKSRFRNLGLQSDTRTKQTLFKAWQAYLRIDRSAIKSPLPEPDFSGAFAAIGAQKESETLVMQALSDPAIPRSFALLTSGAAVVGESKPEQAAKWLLEARAFLPQKPTRGEDGKVVMSLDVNETARFYDRLVGLLETQKQWPEAVTYQRERIEKTGGGRGHLWVLLGQTGDETGQKAVIIELKSPDLKTREILRAAKILIENNVSQVKPINVDTKPKVIKKPVPTEAIEILQALLTAPRVLSVDEQIEARTLLGNALLNSGQLEATVTAVKMEKPEGLPARQQNLWNDLARLQTYVTKATAAVQAEKPKAE